MKRLAILLLLAGCGKPAEVTPPTAKTIASIDAAHVADKAKREEAAKTPATKPTSQRPPSSAPAVDPAKWESISIQTTADEMGREYVRNALTADEKYKGKVVVVYDKISTVRKNNVTDRYYVSSSTGSPRWGVDWYFDKEHESELAKLTPASRVLIIGIVEKKTHFVQIHHCRIIKAAAPNSPTEPWEK